MDRNKSTSRGTKSKITHYPTDIFALGSKSSTSRDSDSKRSQHKSSSSSSSSNSKSTTAKSLSKLSHTSIKASGDRKRDHASIASLPPAKKPKIVGPPLRTISISGSSNLGASHSGAASSGISSERSTDRSNERTNTIEAWETIAVDCDVGELVSNVLQAAKNKDTDKCVSYIIGAIKSLKTQRFKPDKILFYSVSLLAKLRPELFSFEHVTAAVASLLRKSVGETAAHGLKSKGNPALPILCTNILLKSYIVEKNWPELFVRLYVEDALGDRVWVDHEESKPFVDNILTAFNTRIPPKSLLTPELSGGLTSTRDNTSSPIPSSSITLEEDVLREDTNTSEKLLAMFDSKESEMSNTPIIPRYSQSYEIVEKIVLEAIKDQLNRRQTPETITRNFLRLLSATCGLIEIRVIAVSRLEMWLHNPKLMRPAQELLAYLCCNCSTITPRDLEVTAHLTKIRLKTKALVNVYLNCLRELVTLNSENLPTILKYTIYNELSNSRNPNNMPMIAVMFQAAPEVSANILAEIFQDLLCNRDDYLRSLRALLREIVRVLRYDINLYSLCRSLVRERKEITIQLQSLENRERVFHSTIDLLTLCMLLGISPQVKEAAQLAARGDKKDISIVQTYQLMVAKIQREAVTWIHETVMRLYRPQIQDFVHVLHKIFFLEPIEQYYKIDNWPTENDRNLLYRLASEIPLLQATIIRILLIGLSKEHPLSAADTLDLLDQLIKRAAVIPNEGFPPLQADKREIIDFIFNLVTYHHPENLTLPQGYVPPELAISNLYWKSWIILLILSAHNPSSFGSIAWKEYPMLRTFMEMCITNHFSYPPPTVAMGEIFEELKNKELQINVIEKQKILEFESHLAAVSTKIAITEQNSLLISQLMELKPLGDARHPPQIILDQLHSLNLTHRMGHLLCRSRHPDFLLDIIQRQGSSQHMPWLADLVHNSEGMLSHLPVQCLCEYLLISGMHQSSDKNEKQKKHSQVLAHLRTVLIDPHQEVNAAYEVLEYFLRRLNSLHCASRVQAIKALKTILLPVVITEEEPMDEDNIFDSTYDRKHSNFWLMKQIPMLPHFQAIRPVIVSSLRQACQVETDPENISSYINFLAQQTMNDSLPEMSDLVLDLSQLIVERATITAAVLPIPEMENKTFLNTLHSLMLMFCSYLNKVKEPRQEVYQWSESQDQVLINWANGEECTMHILVVHAMIILLTYGPTNDPELFEYLLDIWFPLNSELPKAFLVDTSEEALLIPDWLKLRMIRSSVSRLVDAALLNLEPSQLVLFIQSFGIPVSSMSKLLCMLDSAVTVDQHSVDEAVLDKSYMAQLVEVQHRRGANGGNIFVQVLQLQEPKLPDEFIMKVESNREKLPHHQININKRKKFDCNSIISLLNAIFFETNYAGDLEKDFLFLLEFLSYEINTKPINQTMLMMILEYFTSRLSKADFYNSVLKNEMYTVSLFRIICSLEQPTNEIINCLKYILEKISIKKTGLNLLLCSYVKKKEIKNKNIKIMNIKQNPMDILHKTDSISFEYITKHLVELSLEQKNTEHLLESMARILYSTKVEYLKKTGLIVDWIAELDMEISRGSSDLHMELVFSKHKFSSKDEFKNSEPFRSYFLTLLTHRVSWRGLYVCIEKLLSSNSVEKYNPTVVLDFIQALISNPKLWQGRDKFTPKNYHLEDVLELSDSQVIVLVDYILKESSNCYLNENNIVTSLNRIEYRFTLLLQCLRNKQEILLNVTQYLMKIMKETPNKSLLINVVNLDEISEEQERKNKIQVIEEFLLLLYMKVPKIIKFIPLKNKEQLISTSKITEISTSTVDKITHHLITALASTSRAKDWTRKSQEFELLLRKMTATHPSLVVRQLPMISSSLKGRTHLDFSVFRTRNHLNLFVQTLGIIKLMQPIIFYDEYKNGLESILMTYFSLFKYHGNVKELQSLLGKFVKFLQSYISYDANKALKYLQQHARLLNDLYLTYPNLRALRILMSSISLPKEENPLSEAFGDSGEVLVAVARAPSPEPLPPNWNNLINSLIKPQNNELSNVLQEIDHISNRRPGILKNIVELLCEQILSESNSIRQISHILLLRYLKHRPTIVNNTGTFANPILVAVLKALDSKNSDIVNSILDRLAEYVVCLQEHAVELLEKAFVIGVKSNLNTSLNLTKAIGVLNIQTSVK